MSKRSRKKRSLSQTLFWIMSGLLAATMIISLIVVALPQSPSPTPTTLPTWTPRPLPTWTPRPLPTATPSPTPSLPPPALPTLALPTVQATEPVVGPLPATATAAVTVSPTPAYTATPTPTLTITPTNTPTPSSAGAAWIFAVCGDSRDGPATYRRVLESVATDGSRFLVHLGDLVNRGTEAQWQAFQESMADFPLPFHPVPGNHDGLLGSLDGYLVYSAAPAAHYSFDQGSVHFTLADSHNGGINRNELAWLRKDLSATSQPVKMVFLHHPPFDPDGTDHIMAYGNDAFMALMVEQGVDMVFAGHIHSYAHEERDGVVYVITGGAGAPLYTKDHPQAFLHYLRVTVQDEQVSIEAVKI